MFTKLVLLSLVGYFLCSCGEPLPIESKQALSPVLSNGDIVGGSQLDLVSVRDHIPGSFTVQRSVYADRDRIYLGSAQGTLFLLARDRAADFPIVQTIDLASQITGVRGDEHRLYVVSLDGMLRVFAKGPSLRLVETVALSTFGLATVELFEGKIYVTRGQSQLAVDKSRLYLAELNEGEVALELDKATLRVTRTYGTTFVAGNTVVYDRSTGAEVARIPNPLEVHGFIGFPDIYVIQHDIAELVPGCCGLGITILAAPRFTKSAFIPEAGANAVVAVKHGLLSGTEAGTVERFDRRHKLVQRVDLPALTGHRGAEDIEIRSIWADGLDDLVFAGSSWGNDASRGPSLPSFFVLSLR